MITSSTDPNDYIDAPPEQFAILNRDITLQCAAIPPHMASVTWHQGSTPTSSQLTEVSLDDEGAYTCTTNFFALGPISFDSHIELTVLGKFAGMLKFLIHQQTRKQAKNPRNYYI